MALGTPKHMNQNYFSIQCDKCEKWWISWEGEKESYAVRRAKSHGWNITECGPDSCPRCFHEAQRLYSEFAK